MTAGCDRMSQDLPKALSYFVTMRWTLICRRGLFGTALVLIVFAVAGTYSSNTSESDDADYLRGEHKSVQLNFPPCNFTTVNELLADSTSKWIKALSSELTQTLKITIRITKRLLSSKATAASQWKDTNLAVLSNGALTSVSHIYSSTFSQLKLSSKVLSLIKFPSPAAGLTEDFQLAPSAANFASTLVNKFTTGSPPPVNSSTTIQDALSRALIDASILPDEATASEKSPIEPASASVSSPNFSSQTYKYPISSDLSTLPPSAFHTSSPASLPSSLPLLQTSNAPALLASPPISKTSILPSSLSSLSSVSPMLITPAGEAPTSLFQHSPKGPSPPTPYSASTSLNSGSLSPQMPQFSAQILIPTADHDHRPEQAPTPLISPTFKKTKPSIVISSIPNHPASAPGAVSSTFPHYESSPNLPPILSTPTTEPPGGFSQHTSTGPSAISYPLLTPSEEDKLLSPKLLNPSASILGPSDDRYPPEQTHSALTTISIITKPPSVSSNFIPVLAPALGPILPTSLSYRALAPPSSSLPVPSSTPEVGHVGVSSLKTTPMPPFSQPASALQTPSFFSSPSPSIADSPDSSLYKSRASSPVISHTSFFPAASPFTFSPNALPPPPVPSITSEIAYIGASPSHTNPKPPISQSTSDLKAPSGFNSPSPSNAKSPELFSDKSRATSPIISQMGLSSVTFGNTLSPLHVPSIAREVAHIGVPPTVSHISPFSQPASPLQPSSFFNSPSPSTAKSPQSSLDKSWAISPVISRTGFFPASTPITFSPNPHPPYPVPVITSEEAHIGARPSINGHIPPFFRPASALQAPSFFNSPSPLNATDKRWATSPVISHASFLPVASPFTLSPNTLLPLPLPAISPEVAHMGSPSKSSPVPSFLRRASTLQAPSFFDSPSPSNAKSPEASATSPRMSHTGFMPAASPFTFPPNALPSAISPLHRLENTGLPPQPEMSSSASPRFSQAAAPVVAPLSESIISPPLAKFVVPLPWTLSPSSAGKSAGSPSQQTETDFSSNSPDYRNIKLSPQQAPLTGFLGSHPSPHHFQASAPPQPSSSNSAMIKSPDSNATPSPAPTAPLSNLVSNFPSVGPATDFSSSAIPSADIPVSSPRTSNNEQGSGALPLQTPSTIPSFFHSMSPSLGQPINSASPTPLQNYPSLPSLSNHQTISSASPSTVSSNYPVPLQNLASLPSPSNHQTIPSVSPSTVSPVLGRTSYPVQSSYSPLPINHTPKTPATKDRYIPSQQPPQYVAGPNILQLQPPSLVSKPVFALTPHQAPLVSSPPTRKFSPTTTMSMSPAFSVTKKPTPTPSKLSFGVPTNSPHSHTISKPLTSSPHSNPQYPVSPPLLGQQVPQPVIINWPRSPQNTPVTTPGPQTFGNNSGSSSQHSPKRDADPPYAPLPEHAIKAPQTSTSHILASPTTESGPRSPQQPRAPLQPVPTKENTAVLSPKHNKGHVVPAMPPMIYFPPPPNTDCHQACADPYTSTPPGSGCGCVIPMVLGIELGTALYSLFPLVSELAQEIAEGTFLSQSQVRIMAANTVSDNLDKTEVKAYMVPLGVTFDHTVAVLIAQRFWSHQVFINKTFFGNYSVLYIDYPGLPPSPPSQYPVGGPNFEQIKGGSEDSYAKPLSINFVTSHSRLSGRIKAIIVICCIIAAVIILGVIWMLSLRFSQLREHPALMIPTLGSSMTKRSVLTSSLGSSESMSLTSSLTASTASSKIFTLAELGKATKNFRHENIIGEGGFGRVYKGILEDDTKVAVKVLTRDDEQGVREFSAEVEMLSRLHHRNLVKLQGTCVEESIRCLVYELIPNGSVESHLHGDHKISAPLSWEVRLKIALGSAKGLAYLHEDSNPRVIHRDFKSSNILLEDDFNPKVSDFGLAKAASEEVGGHVSTRVMGTFGYVAPEYAMTGHLLVKSDVYSYGVVLLELLSGRKPVNISGVPGEENLVTWARPLLKNKEGLKMLVDPNLGADVQFDDFVKVAAIASMCVQPEVIHRPFMGEVVQALKLVCNDSEASEAPSLTPSLTSSRNNSLSAEFPLRKSNSKTSLVDSLRSGSRSMPDDSSFITIDYDSGSLATPNEELIRPVSDYAIFSRSVRYIKQISRSFSGPLRTVQSNPEWCRFRSSTRGSMSEHDLDIQGTVKYNTDLWP